MLLLALQASLPSARAAVQYDVEQLAERGDFNDSAYLLLHGELPSAEQKAAFDRDLTQHSLVHEQLIMCANAHSQLPSPTHACEGNRPFVVRVQHLPSAQV